MINNVTAKDIIKKAESISNRKVVFCSLVGSHNYGLNDEHSDKDFKAFVLPTFDDLYDNKMYSYNYTSEEADFTIHDVRTIPKLMYKSNINFLEIFFSKDSCYWPTIGEFVQRKEEIAAINIPYLYKACIGMHFEKIKRRDKYIKEHCLDTTKYQSWSKEDKLAVGKENCHAYRVLDVINQYIGEKASFAEAINYEKNSIKRDALLDIKHGNYALAEDLNKLLLETVKSDKFAEMVKSSYSPNDELYKRLSAEIKLMVLTRHYASRKRG